MKSAVVVTKASGLTQILTRGLAALGPAAEVQFKDSFDEALAQLAQKKPEFAVLDWGLAPLQETCEFLQKLRKTAGCRNTPLIVFARELSPQIIAAGSDYGISKVLQEKSLGDTLLPAVEAVIQELAKPSSLRSHLVRLEIAAERQAFGEVDRIVEDFFALYPDHPRALVEYANLCIRRGNWGKAAQVVQQAGERYPDNLRVINLKARLTMHEGRMGEAIALLEKADMLSPKNLERLVLFGDAYRSSGDNDTSRAYYDQALEVDGESVDAKKGLGLVELSEGEVNAALELFRDSASEEEVGGFFNNTAIMSVRGREFDKAKKLYTAARDHLTTPALKAKVCFNLGLAYRKWEKPESAILAFREALRFDESFDKARRALAGFPQDLVSRVEELAGEGDGAALAREASGPAMVDLEALEAGGGRMGGGDAGAQGAGGLGTSFADVEVYEETFAGNALAKPAPEAPVAGQEAGGRETGTGGGITLKSDEKTMSPFSVKVIESEAAPSASAPSAVDKSKPAVKLGAKPDATEVTPPQEPRPPAPKFLAEEEDF